MQAVQNYIDRDTGTLFHVVHDEAFINCMYNPFSNQLTEAGLVLENGRSVQLNVEEETKRGIGPAATLLQRMVELTVLVVLRNLKNVTLNPVQVGLKFALVRVHSSIKIVSRKKFLT